MNHTVWAAAKFNAPPDQSWRLSIGSTSRAVERGIEAYAGEGDADAAGGFDNARGYLDEPETDGANSVF